VTTRIYCFKVSGISSGLLGLGTALRASICAFVKKTFFASGQVHKSPMQLHLLTSNMAGCSATACVVNPAITSTAANGVARNCITPVAPLSRLAFSRSKGKAPRNRSHSSYLGRW
jgi:hypothetical protein